MDRVAIIGPGGAGKSTLARRLGAITGLPVIHLDREHWQPGWVEPPREAWGARVAELASGDRWIIDGNYGGTMETRFVRADTIVYLDFGRLACIRRVLQRRLQYRSGSRPDMADGCPERVTLSFLRWLWNYQSMHRAETLGLLAAAVAGGKRVHILRDDRQVQHFLVAAVSGDRREGGSPRRINLIGGSGSGKTTVGEALAARLGAPAFDLGQLFGPSSHAREFQPSLSRHLDAMLSEERWVIEGSHWLSLQRRLDEGDVTVFMDRPACVRIRRIVRRKRGGWRNVGMEAAWAALFRAGERRHIGRLLTRAAPTQPVFVVRTDREAAAVLNGLAPLDSPP